MDSEFSKRQALRFVDEFMENFPSVDVRYYRPLFNPTARRLNGLNDGDRSIVADTFFNNVLDRLKEDSSRYSAPHVLALMFGSELTGSSAFNRARIEYLEGAIGKDVFEDLLAHYDFARRELGDNTSLQASILLLAAGPTVYDATPGEMRL